MAKILEQLSDAIPIYQEAYPEDVSIVICSTEIVYSYLPGKDIDLKLVEGNKVDEESAATEVMRTGKRMEMEIESATFGIPYVVTASPIYEDGNLVGSISLVASIKKLDAMRKLSKDLFAAVDSIASATEQIVTSSNEVADFVEEISTEYNEMAKDISNIDEIVKFIQKNAMQSKILGLNASIEAARAGAAGKGFAVVSNEIQKMGKESEQSSLKINEQLTHIMKTIEELNASIQSIAANTHEHAASIDEIKASFNKIETMTKKLFDIAVN